MRFEKITIPPSFYSLILLWVDSSLRCYEMRAFQHINSCSILLLVCRNWMRETAETDERGDACMHSHLFHKYSLIRLPATSWKHCTHFLSFLEPISTHLLFPESYRGSSGVTYITFFFLVCTTFPLSHCLWHLELQASGESMNTTVRQDFTFPSLTTFHRS